MVEPRVVHRAAQNTDEQSLVARVRAGDPRAFETIFRAHHPALCDFVYRYTRSRAEAEGISIKTVEIYITRGTKAVRAAYAEIRTP